MKYAILRNLGDLPPGSRVNVSGVSTPSSRHTHTYVAAESDMHEHINNVSDRLTSVRNIRLGSHRTYFDADVFWPHLLLGPFVIADGYTSMDVARDATAFARVEDVVARSLKKK